MNQSSKKLFSILSLFFFTITGCNNVSSISSLTSLSNTSISYLTSEDKGTATIRIYKDNNSTSKERYIAPKNVNIKYPPVNGNFQLQYKNYILFYIWRQ